VFALNGIKEKNAHFFTGLFGTAVGLNMRPRGTKTSSSSLLSPEVWERIVSVVLSTESKRGKMETAAMRTMCQMVFKPDTI
jgi:hypothetical protein